ncbi:hypothetical protein U1Q18_031332 [Sarracenia purpurea var. burkii]
MDRSPLHGKTEYQESFAEFFWIGELSITLCSLLVFHGGVVQLLVPCKGGGLLKVGFFVVPELVFLREQGDFRQNEEDEDCFTRP